MSDPSAAGRGPPGGSPARRHYRGRIDAAPPPSPADDEAAVRLVVERFYAAFEARDLDAMSDLWAHEDDVACTHPGWATLHGWAAVSASWFAIFDQVAPLQVFVTDERVRVDGDVAWVTLDENLLGAAGDAVGTTAAALNVLRRHADGWRVVAHHGSVVEVRPGA